jgi:DNA-binding NarL/FixJ family response regulator
MRIDLAAIPRREPGMAPFEVMISESQERMLAVVEPTRWDEVRAVCERWGLPVAVIGRVTDDGDITVVGEASTAAEALARVPAVRPDVAVLDVRLPDGDGVTVCRELRSQLPELGCLMLTSFADDDALYNAILAGAAGYVLKQIKGRDLIDAVHTIAAGGSLLDAKATARVMQRLRDEAAEREREDPYAALTEQERRILELIGEGLTNRQIGERMFLAEKTVKNYVSSLLSKLGLERRTQAAILATEHKREQH